MARKSKDVYVAVQPQVFDDLTLLAAMRNYTIQDLIREELHRMLDNENHKARLARVREYFAPAVEPAGEEEANAIFGGEDHGTG